MMYVARLLLAAGLLLPMVPLAAQQPAPTATIAAGDTVVLTLRDALLRAEPASEQVNIGRRLVDRSRADKTVAWSLLLPQVTLTPGYTRVVETPFRQFFSGGGGGGVDLGSDNPFTATTNWALGGNATWTPIDFAAYSQISAASRGIDVARLQLSSQQAYTILTAAAAYYNALLADQLLGIRIATLEQAMKHEDELLYDEPPAWYHPMRQELGAVHLAKGHAAVAEKLYREDLVHYPNNGWSLYGLARSLQAQNKSAEAAKVDAEYRKWWDKADVKPLALAK